MTGRPRSPGTKHQWMAGNTVNGQFVVRLERNTSGNWIAIVRCGCGKERKVEPKSLTSGRSKSCKICAVTSQTGPLSRGWRGGKHVPLTVFNKFKRAAERRGIPWKITIRQLDNLYESQGMRCALSGERLIFDFGHDANASNGNASLDRENAKKGYRIGNVQLTTKTINVCKQLLSNFQFVSMCKAVSAHHVDAA